MDKLLNMLRYKSEGSDIDFKSTQYRFNNGSSGACHTRKTASAGAI
ncbi:Uncharacterised protein [Klebsiella pneumoniae]|nr:Uncharacterised protein [Klebsiella pneumoniae]